MLSLHPRPAILNKELDQIGNGGGGGGNLTKLIQTHLYNSCSKYSDKAAHCGSSKCVTFLLGHHFSFISCMAIIGI